MTEKKATTAAVAKKAPAKIAKKSVKDVKKVVPKTGKKTPRGKQSGTAKYGKATVLKLKAMKKMQPKLNRVTVIKKDGKVVVKTREPVGKYAIIPAEKTKKIPRITLSKKEKQAKVVADLKALSIAKKTKNSSELALITAKKQANRAQKFQDRLTARLAKRAKHGVKETKKLATLKERTKIRVARSAQKALDAEVQAKRAMDTFRKSKTECKTMSAHQAEIFKRAMVFIDRRRNRNITRRSSAKKVFKDDEGRTIFVKDRTNQTKESLIKPKNRMLRPSNGFIERNNRREMMKMVRKICWERAEARRVAMIKAKKPDAVVVPKERGFCNEHTFAKRVVVIRKLPQDVKRDQIQQALSKYGKGINKIGSAYKKTVIVVVKGEKKKVIETRARVTMKNETHAKNLIARLKGIRIGRKHVLFFPDIVRRTRPSAERIAERKAAKEAKKAEMKVQREKKAETEKNQQRRFKSRYHPQVWSKKVERDGKGRLLKIRRNPKAKSQMAMRKNLSGQRALKANPRLTRK